MKDLDEMNNIEDNEVCPDCHGTGRVIGKNGSIGVCMKCLIAGKMDQHTTKIKDAKEFGVKI
jgi:ribosomal protein L37AE/L43A